MGKESSAGFFLLIGGGEREGVVPVLHVNNGRLTACRSCGNVVQHRSPVLGWTHAWRSRFEADPCHCSTGLGSNH
jgi:hypothetical protein